MEGDGAAGAGAARRLARDGDGPQPAGQQRGRIAYRVWPHDSPARVVILAHGYGGHIGRYEHVAAHWSSVARLSRAPTTWATGNPRASACWWATTST